jgi:hypothetical protein
MQDGVTLMGGLGNQLFQLAFFLFLRRNGVDANCLVTNYQNDTYGRTPLLDRLKLDTQIITLDTFIQTAKRGACEVTETEGLIHNISAIKEISRNQQILFTGYWQNIRLLLESGLEHYLSPKHYEFSDFIALHVRRNDYAHHGLICRNYFDSILNRYPETPFVVFTDEPNVIKSAFRSVKNFVGISHDFGQIIGKAQKFGEIDELRMLSSHSVIVISNSTFSWIAAYLGWRHNGAQVYYPSMWSISGHEPMIAPPYTNNWHEVPATLSTF